MSDRPIRGEQIGDAIARVLDPEADAAKRAIWRRVARVLDGVFTPKAIDVLVDPMSVEVYMPDGTWCWARTVAWQINGTTGFPIALWLKVSDDSKDWVKIWPAEGRDDHKVAVNEDDAASETWDYLEYKLSSPNGTVSFTPVAGTPPTLGLDVVCSDEDPLPNGPEADPGSGPKPAAWNHIHPQSRPEKIRYYCTDVLREVGESDFLLSTQNPYEEADAIDLTHAGLAAYWLTFVSPEGSPGVALWPGGSLRAHFRVKMTNPQSGRNYRLYTGNREIVYTSLIWDWTNSDVYQSFTSPYPEQPEITEAYATVEFDIPVTALAAGASARLGLNLRMRVYVDDEEAVFDDEHIVVRVGGDDASYIDTLFTPDGGFSGVHNDLDGRSENNSHPMSAITPGRIITPSNPVVASVDGLFAVPSNSNFVVLDGAEDLIGCSVVGWTGANSLIEVMVMSERNFLRSQSPLPDDYYPFLWGYSDTGYGGDYDVFVARPFSIWGFRFVGGGWRLAYSMNV